MPGEVHADFGEDSGDQRLWPGCGERKVASGLQAHVHRDCVRRRIGGRLPTECHAGGDTSTEEAGFQVGKREVCGVAIAWTGGRALELSAAGCRELVESCPAMIRRLAPDGIDPAVSLQAVEGGVERTFFAEEFIAGGLVKKLNDAVAMELAWGQRPKYQHV